MRVVMGNMAEDILKMAKLKHLDPQDTVVNALLVWWR